MVRPSKSVTQKNPKSKDSNKIISLALMVIAGVALIRTVEIPEVFNFNDMSKIELLRNFNNIGIHLSDDVMISMRAGLGISRNGFPDLNSGDIAQASTSYLTPYLYFLLKQLFGINLGLALYAGLGVLSLLATCHLLIRFSKSKVVAGCLTILLIFTSTSRIYVANGWDHLFQGFFLTAACFQALKTKKSNLSNFLFFLSLVLAIMSRPDSTLIVIGILLTAIKLSRNKIRLIKYWLTPTLFILVSLLALNFYHYNHFLPTTVRLKYGSSPSFSYSMDYIFLNALQSYSVISLFFLCLLFYFFLPRSVDKVHSIPIVLGCIATGAIAFVNSDVFVGGRLFWGSTCVMLAIIASLVDIQGLIKIQFDGYEHQLFRLGTERFYRNQRKIALTFLIIFISSMVLSESSLNLKQKVNNRVVTNLNVESSQTSKQYLIASWINKNLQPSDGPIGLYWLGMSFHLAEFEVADFLGKGDELIASSMMKWGPPGHNKWNTSATLEKWNPQAIIPPSSMEELTRPEASRRNILKSDYGFESELRLNQQVNKLYKYCFIADSDSQEKDYYGFYLRRDVLVKKSDSLKCIDLN